MKVTIKEVAKLAEVSTSTVSRVISNDSRISSETKEKVNKAIKELGYRPNAIARSLANKKTKTLGIVLPTGAEGMIDNPFFIKAMEGISKCAQMYGYYIMYAFSNVDNDSYNCVEDFVNSRLVDGICLLTSASDDKCINYLRNINFPFVVIGRPDDKNNILWVDNDNVKAMYDVVNRVIELGHKRIAFIGAQKNLNVSQDRLKGYINAIFDARIQFDGNIIIQEKGATEEYGYKAMKRILDSGEEVSAVVTTDDLLSLGVLKALKEANRNLCIVGFNNIVLTEYQTPTLSSVDIKSVELGYSATGLLIKKLEGENKESFVIVETTLIERESMQTIE